MPEVDKNGASAPEDEIKTLPMSEENETGASRKDPTPGPSSRPSGPVNAPLAFVKGHTRASSSPARSSSDFYEDARSEPYRSSASVERQQNTQSEIDDDDLDLLPPLETFFAPLPTLVERASLTGSLENDLLPSTPLTEEQLRHADSVLKVDVLDFLLLRSLS